MSLRLMPEGIEINHEELKKEVIKKLEGVAEGQVGFKITPIAFGLKALDITLIATEEKGSKIEELLKTIKGVQTVIVQSVSLV